VASAKNWLGVLASALRQHSQGEFPAASEANHGFSEALMKPQEHSLNILTCSEDPQLQENEKTASGSSRLANR